MSSNNTSTLGSKPGPSEWLEWLEYELRTIRRIDLFEGYASEGLQCSVIWKHSAHYHIDVDSYASGSSIDNLL